MRATACAIALGAVLVAVAAGCSGSGSEESSAATPQPNAPPTCPGKWRAGWQQLANRIGVPVYCPTWMPSPLDAEIGGQWNSSGPSVSKDRSYLVGFLWHEANSGDVHVNFRAYPGRTAIPRCEDTQVVAGKVRHRDIPCFSDAQPPHRVGRFRVTPYTVNQGVDQWHVLYLWRERGSIYTVSQHVAKPTPYRQVVANLDRMMRGLVLVGPTA